MKENQKTKIETQGTASYCPEDDKIRLYVGRVPRPEYDRLRSEGWVSTPKQAEAGKGEFAAVWTPERRDTALEFADIIEDEDAGPAERAADRAERFGGYRDKRTGEATGHADRYDSQPSAHGYQNEARAERAANRHDRIGTRAVDAWSKAEYWTRRTAGVIGHALYVSSPSVRMGRIKTLEAELRKRRASVEDRKRNYRNWLKLRDIADPAKQTEMVRHYVGTSHQWAEYKHPRPSDVVSAIESTSHPRAKELCELYTTRRTSIYTLITQEYAPITGAEAVALWFSDHSEPSDETEWTLHLTLRLSYENQMLEAQGGRAAFVEIQVGGKIGSKLILKVNKSHVTGRVVSVQCKGPRVEGWHYQTSSPKGVDYSLYEIKTERLPESAYTAPTPESLAEVEALKAKQKASAPKKAPCPLINPTDADAERLQTVWNERAKARHDAREGAKYGKAFEPIAVTRIDQATYSANSKGAYGRAETRGISRDCYPQRRSTNMYSGSGHEYDKRIGPAVCMIRITGYDPYSVIILTDKPQRNLPAAVWEKYETPAESETDEKVLHGKSHSLTYTVNA